MGEYVLNEPKQRRASAQAVRGTARAWFCADNPRRRRKEQCYNKKSTRRPCINSSSKSTPKKRVSVEKGMICHCLVVSSVWTKVNHRSTSVFVGLWRKCKALWSSLWPFGHTNSMLDLAHSLAAPTAHKKGNH